MTHLRLIDDSAHDGVFNMQADEELFKAQIQTRDQNPMLRFYRFEQPTFTIGYGLWKSFHSGSGIGGSMIRRVTGGGIVRHGDDLTYALILPIGRKAQFRRPQDSYHEIHQALVDSLTHFGVPAKLFGKEKGEGDGQFCFDSPVLDDVMLESKKIAGGAQKRSQGFLLHQGSIVWPDVVAHTRVSETAFRAKFATQIAAMLGVKVKEVPFRVGETHLALV